MQIPARAPSFSLQEIVKLSREFEAHLGEQLTVNPTDLAAMEQLIMSGPLGPSELARRLKITPPAVTAVVDRLEELGHATREVNPDDRRAVVVTPAPASVQKAMGILMPMISDVDATLDGFDAEQQAVIAQYLERVVDAYRGHLPLVISRREAALRLDIPLEMANRHGLPARMTEAELEAMRADPPPWLAQSWANRTGKKPVWVQLTCDICGFTEAARPKKWWPAFTWLSCEEHAAAELPALAEGFVRGEVDGIGSRFIGIVDEPR